MTSAESETRRLSSMMDRCGLREKLGLEPNFKVGLAFSPGIVLTVNDLAEVSIGKGQIWRSENYAIESIEVLNFEFQLHVFTYGEIFRGRNVFVVIEGIAKVREFPRFIAEEPRR
jgi:hypothetical protein